MTWQLAKYAKIDRLACFTVLGGCRFGARKGIGSRGCIDMRRDWPCLTIFDQIVIIDTVIFVPHVCRLQSSWKEELLSRLVFEQRSSWKSTVWSANSESIVQQIGCGQTKLRESVELNLFASVVRRGLRPDQLSLNSLTSACAQAC